MPTAASINQLLLFLGFTGFAFILLRLTFRFAAEGRMILAIAPALAAFGALAAFVFLRLKLADFLVWHLVFLLVVFVAWWRKTRLDAEQLAQFAQETARRSGGSAAEIGRTFMAARQALTLGFVCYVVVFLTIFFSLLPRP
jgi:hypothetical protein